MDGNRGERRTEQISLGAELEVGHDAVPTFGKRFLDDHAGRIISKPEIALVELVANTWDAGARRVDISWPDQAGGEIVIEDDGVGLSPKEFNDRWTRMNYNRLENQGRQVAFPPGVAAAPRLAWGRNGKGRHAMFAFDDVYHVLTRRDGVMSHWEVSRQDEPTAPFRVRMIDRGTTDQHGLTLNCRARRSFIPEERVIDAIGSRFVADPQFEVAVNGHLIALSNLDDEVVMTRTVRVGETDVVLRCIDGRSAGRTMQQSGVAWWVNGRRVGPVSWSVNGDSVVDGRSHVGKRYTIIVYADALADFVRPDWSAFSDEELVRRYQEEILQEIGQMIKDLAGSNRREQKVDILSRHREEIRALSPLGQDVVGDFLDEVQRVAPTIRRSDLEHATRVMIELEKSRHGTRLLDQLSGLDASDLDSLTEILDSWSVREAQIVLDELGDRLALIDRLEKLVDDPATKELQQLQPLLERGLWIFGPEFESVHYTSNRQLATVMSELFGSEGLEVESSARRPDFVVLPGAGCAYSTFSCDAFKDGEAADIDKVLVLELKRGGSTVGSKEMDQARAYVRALRRSGKVPETASITAFVLGSKVDEREIEQAPDRMIPRTYERVLNSARSRTFRLKEKIEEHARTTDPEVREVLKQQGLPRQ